MLRRPTMCLIGLILINEFFRSAEGAPRTAVRPSEYATAITPDPIYQPLVYDSFLATKKDVHELLTINN